MEIDFEQEIEEAWEKVRELLEKNPHYTEKDIKEVEEQEKPVVDAHSFIQLLEGFEYYIFGADVRNGDKWAIYKEDELLDGAVYDLVCWEVVKSIMETALTPYLVAERLSGETEQKSKGRGFHRFNTLEGEIQDLWKRKGMQVLEEKFIPIGEEKYQWVIVATTKIGDKK